jgi:hypothetical protein
MPFGPYTDFDDCVKKQQAKGHNLETAKRICGALMKKLESDDAGKDDEQNEGDDCGDGE